MSGGVRRLIPGSLGINSIICFIKCQQLFPREKSKNWNYLGAIIEVYLLYHICLVVFQDGLCNNQIKLYDNICKQKNFL